MTEPRRAVRALLLPALVSALAAAGFTRVQQRSDQSPAPDLLPAARRCRPAKRPSRFPSHLARRLVAALQLLGGTAHAQESAAPAPAPHDRFWISAGLGVGQGPRRAPPELGLAASVSATYQPGVPVMSVRTAGVWGIIHGDILADVAVLAGVGTRGRSSHASIAIGPALTRGTIGSFGGHPVDYPSTLGAAIQVQLFGIALQSLGLGLSGFADLNRHQSFGGVTLSLTLGQLPR